MGEPVYPECEWCYRHHDPALPHCSNCGQADGYHASWDLGSCSCWDDTLVAEPSD